MTAFRKQPQTVALAVLCIALVAVILVEFHNRPRPALDPSEYELPAAAASDPRAAPHQSEAPEIPIAAAIERPLFSPARSQLSAPAAVDPVPTTSGLSLIGITISPADRVAVLVPVGGGAPERVREGETYDGWWAVSIEPDHVVFRQGAVEEKIYLNFNLPAPVAVQPSVDGSEPASQQESWSGGEPPDREEAGTAMGGGDGSSNP